MSISLERDSRLPSSVFRKSSRQPEEREVAAELPHGDPTLAGLASQAVGCCPSGREVGGTLSGLSYPENKPPTAAGASALQKLPSQPSQLPRGADVLPAARRASGLSQGQGHTVKELLIPCMAFQSIFCPLTLCWQTFCRRGCKKSPELQRLIFWSRYRGQTLFLFGI